MCVCVCVCVVGECFLEHEFKFIFFRYLLLNFPFSPRMDCMYKISKWVLFLGDFDRMCVCVWWLRFIFCLCFNLYVFVNLVLFFVALFACDKMWMFFFCFIYVKIKFTFSYSYHSSNLGHVRKYTHKRSSFCYFYFTILHQVATIFVVSSVFFVSCNLAGIFPIFRVWFFLFYIWGGRILFFC